MENLYDKVKSMKKIKLLPEQVLIENNITIDSNDEILKILAVNTSVDVENPIDVLSSECTVTGKTITNIIYETTNGELNNQNSISPFSYKLNNENLCNGAKLNIRANVASTSIDKVMGNTLKLVTTINIESLIIKNEEIEYLKDGGESTYSKQEEHDITEFSGGYCEKFEEKLEANIKTGVKKVLMTNVECLLKDWHAGPNFIAVECELYAKVLYADNQEISELQTLTISKTIKQEFEVNGINKDTGLDLYAVIMQEGVVTELVENGEEININVCVPIMVCYNTYCCNKVLSISDIYSEREVVSVKNDDVENCVELKPEYLEGKIEGNVTISDSQPRIDKYLATTNICSLVSNSYIKDGMVYLEGIVSANVIYLNDELGSLQSVELEIPYVLNKKLECVNVNILEPFVGLFDVDVMVKRGREIYFDAKAKAYINLTAIQTFELISKVESIGNLPEKDGAIEIYFGKAGESLWDIAKNLNIPSEIIVNQNPEMTDPLEKDQNIALYYQKNRKI